MSDTRKKQLVWNFIDFLRQSAEDGTIKEDDKESLEVAIQCLGESFGVDPDSDSDKAAYSIKPASLLSLMDVLNKAKGKAAPAAAQAPAAEAAGSSSGTSESDKKEAEAHKTKGNQLMSQKKYSDAIKEYTAAIALDPNPVYYSNRAAAWSGLGKHESACDDAERAIELDPKFAKGYSRLGHALYCLNKFAEACEAYENGLKVDPSNANMKNSLATARSRADEAKSNAVSDREPAPGGAPGAGAGAGGMPDLSSLAGLMGGLGGGGGGMPDIASLMQNPQMMQMAQQLMSNGGMERLMSNPTLRNMADNMQSGGGMPDFNQLAQDPAMRDLAQQFMGSGGLGGQGGAPGGDNGNGGGR